MTEPLLLDHQYEAKALLQRIVDANAQKYETRRYADKRAAAKKGWGK